MATRSLAKLKGEMLFNQDLGRLVDAMKGIAAAQYQMMERKQSRLERFDKALDELFRCYDFRRSRHPFVRSVNARRLICLVTTDSGFLGGLNMKVVQAAVKYETSETHYLVIGERGANYLREFNRSYTDYPGINADDTRFDLAQKIADQIATTVLKREFGQVLLVYPRSLSFTAQKIEVLNLVPCPLFFKDRKRHVPLPEAQAREVILESAPSDVMEYLTRLWLRKRLVEIFESSKLSEFGARTMHLEDSYQTLTKINKQLKLDFFKARREKIDQSLRESFTAQLMMED